MGFLQDIKSWIFYPKKVIFSASVDGHNFEVISEVLNTFPDSTYGSFHQDFSSTVNVNARYIKVQAEHYGFCPPWHLGSGGKTWLFADEIVIK